MPQLPQLPHNPRADSPAPTAGCCGAPHAKRMSALLLGCPTLPTLPTPSSTKRAPFDPWGTTPRHPTGCRLTGCYPTPPSEAGWRAGGLAGWRAGGLAGWRIGVAWVRAPGEGRRPGRSKTEGPHKNFYLQLHASQVVACVKILQSAIIICNTICSTPSSHDLPILAAYRAQTRSD